MKVSTVTRRLLSGAVAVAAALCVALTFSSISLRRAATARDVPIAASARAPAAPSAALASASHGLVCFGTVDLEQGVTSLYLLQPGRVAEVLVRENQAVAEGTTLLRLEDAAPRSRLAEAEAALELSRLQLQQARKLPEQHRVRVARQQSSVQLVRKRLDAVRELLARRQKLALQPNPVAAVNVSASEMQVRELEELERAENQRLSELQTQDPDADIRRAELELAIAEARRDQARLVLDECRLKAPRAGTVLRILVGPGDVLGGERGGPALLFAADGPQVIKAAVEQEFASRIKEGEAVRVQDETDGALTWRGRVERVAGWFSQRRAVLHDPSQMSDVRTLECVIVLEPGQPPLRLGQGVRVFVGDLPP